MNYCKPKIHFRFISVFLVLLCYFFNPKNSFGQEFKFQNGRKQQTILFSQIKNLVIIPIYINGKGPFDFILDTGVNPMIVTDSTLKESLKVPYVRSVKVGGYGNFDGVDAFLGATSVSIGDADCENVPTVFLKNDVLSLSGHVGRKIYGLIGYHFFNSFVVKINYALKTLRFTSPEKKIKLRGEKIPFELIENKPYVDVDIIQDGIGSKTLKTLVDCGASHAISLESLAQQPFPQPLFTIHANLGNGLTGPIKGKMGRITSLKLGNFTFKEVLANYPEYRIDSGINKARNANLGADILSRFETTYDYRNRCMYIKKGERFNQPFEHDMAGIELYIENGPPSRTIISRIESGSPAEQVGLKEGDEITAINFKRIDDYPMGEIGNIFKAKNGYSVIVEIWRGKKLLIKLLKLKKRI